MRLKLPPRFQIHRSIRRKFLAYTVLPIVVVFGIFLPLSLQELERATAGRIQADRTTLVELNATNINRAFNQLAELAEMNAAFLHITPDMSEANIYQLLTDTVKSDTFVYGAAVAYKPYAFNSEKRLFAPYVYRKEGDLVTMDIGDQTTFQGYDYVAENREWWAGPIDADAAMWTRPYFDDGAGNTRMITYSVPFERGEEVVGVVTVDIELDTLFDILGTLSGGFDAIIDQDGMWIYSPLQSTTTRGIGDLVTQFDNETIEQLLTDIRAEQGGRIRAVRHTLPTDSDAVIQDWVLWWYYTPIQTTEWAYLYFQSESEVLAAARAQWRVLAILFCFVVLLVVGIIWFMSGRLTRPIISLHRAAESVSRGDFDVHIETRSEDELGKLSSVFNRMAASMKTREEDLEHEVQIRTEELQNSQLRITAQNEELRIAKDSAEAATAAKASFLASMSHEIRTPMNGILGMVELLSHSRVSEEQRHMIATIHESGKTLLTIINDILDLSKIEAGRLQLESIPFSLQEVIEGTAETLAGAAAIKKVRLVTFVDTAIPSLMEGDSVRMRQILVNLLGNAIKFSEQGEVSVRAELLPEQSPDGILLIKISVRDQGIGIAPEIQGQLFQPFMQAESSTTRKYGGTGLGLSICQRLVTMMDGSIEVSSVLGEGSEFSVTLPFCQHGAPLPAELRDQLSDVKVIVFSRSAMEARACQEYLEYWGASVSCIEYEEALRESCTDSTPPQVIILGVTLSPEEQLGCITRAREMPAFSQTKFCLLQGGRRLSARLVDEVALVLDANPLRRSSLLNVVSIALGRESPEVRSEAPLDISPVAALGIEDALRMNCLILVAEDNPTNQDVIQRQLALLGYACEVADDGELALQAWRTGRYAALLTDCHMPNRDGFSLTAAIREEEGRSGRHCPVIAITANALQGEAEKCIAAGMDDYMSKPIEMKVLAEKLAQWLPDYRPAKAPEENTVDPSAVAAREAAIDGLCVSASVTPIDDRVLKDIFGDDDATFREILQDFLAPSQEIVAELLHGLSVDSAELVVQAAHKLKSSARSVGAARLADICVRMEAAGKAGHLAPLRDELADLEATMGEITAYIQSL